jgi:uncharacterized protein (DUF488 family)
MDFWTIGHSTHSLDGFVALLSAHDIELVADVRTVPKSIRHPHFHTTALAQTLPRRAVRYRHLPRLGGWRRAGTDSPNTAWRNLSFRGYADYALTDDFAMGLEELRELAAHSRTAMMCSEALWWRCHRRLIADHLVAAGGAVFHIESNGRVSRHELTAFAHVTDEGAVTYPADDSA